MAWNNRIKEAIAKWPMLFGMSVGFVLCILMLGAVILFPGFVDSWGRHRNLVEAGIITTIDFGAYIYCLRAWRRYRVFWPTICLIFLLHVLGVFLYSSYIGPILMWQWVFIGLGEFFFAGLMLQKMSGSGTHAGR
jgi:hypothetical protein